ncbi:hypothetical protein RN347_07315 [Halomonas sp. PAMB 3264]|uniref:hypothetical protein n=1 Tax=Halomonas sp. PAMB 3264 TaxID=3075222 RepID=UPI00289AE5ED|nr:hypothetical protein [Halomonas sp. PAMB 3264]WNL43702.1 hypothetical protein RN347_07315 [Halomonas sp. PAMB 3264]
MKFPNHFKRTSGAPLKKAVSSETVKTEVMLGGGRAARNQYVAGGDPGQGQTRGDQTTLFYARGDFFDTTQ